MRPTEDTTGKVERVVSVNDQGTVTTPEKLQDRHGIEPGGKVRIRETGEGTVVIEPVRSLREFRGAATDGPAGTDVLAEERSRDAE